MAWPENMQDVKCVGFSRDLLPLLRTAIDDKRVKWGEESMFAESGSAEFDYLGFRYRLHEFMETVTKIEKIARLGLAPEDIDGDHPDVVVEVLEEVEPVSEHMGTW